MPSVKAPRRRQQPPTRKDLAPLQAVWRHMLKGTKRTPSTATAMRRVTAQKRPTLLHMRRVTKAPPMAFTATLKTGTRWPLPHVHMPKEKARAPLRMRLTVKGSKRWPADLLRMQKGIKPPPRDCTAMPRAGDLQQAPQAPPPSGTTWWPTRKMGLWWVNGTLKAKPMSSLPWAMAPTQTAGQTHFKSMHWATSRPQEKSLPPVKICSN